MSKVKLFRLAQSRHQGLKGPAIMTEVERSALRTAFQAKYDQQHRCFVYGMAAKRLRTPDHES